MNDDDIARMLGSLGEGPEPRLPDEARRSKILGAMQDTARPARRWARFAALVASVAAVALLAYLGLRKPAPAPIAARPPAAGEARSISGEALLMRAGSVRSVSSSDRSLELGDRLSTTADGRVTVRLGGVAFASLSPMTEISVEPEGCELRAGTASFEVDPLPRGKRFLVRAPDLDIEVHGTAFRVVVARGQPTRVIVTEGVVSVSPRSGERGARLGAGEQWPSPAAPSPASPSSALPTPSASPSSASPSDTAAAPAAAGGSPSAPAHGARPSASQAGGGARPSDLAEQNRLLLEAAEAKRRGDTAAEKRALESYLSRFPNAPGSHDALASKMRAAAKGKDPREWERAAKAYLGAFPGGPLAAEARALLSRRAP